MSQFLQTICGPRGARTGRGLATRWRADRSVMALRCRSRSQATVYLTRQVGTTRLRRMGFPDTARSAVALRPAAPYARVKQFLKEELARGHWLPGALMPSDAELVAKFGVSRMTVTRALRELQAEGLVERVQGVGTFAAHLARVSSTLTIRDLHEEIVSRGHRH